MKKDIFSITITISIAENTGSKRAVTINNDLSHYIDTAISPIVLYGYYSWLTFEKLQLELKRLLSTVRRMVSLKIPVSPLKKRRGTFTPRPGGSPWN
jgi:uncharacterized protein with ParB-like and HNH nuclease domain